MFVPYEPSALVWIKLDKVITKNIYFKIVERHTCHSVLKISIKKIAKRKSVSIY